MNALEVDPRTRMKTPCGAAMPSPVRLSPIAGMGRGQQMDIREEQQRNPVADEVSALVAVTRPIIAGVLQSISNEMPEAADIDRPELALKLLGRIRKEGDGDTGIAFEYAVHDAVMRGEPMVAERIADALKRCRIEKGDPASILFAIEKHGAKQLISTDLDRITANSRVLSGKQGQPVKLKKHLNQIAAAFRRANTRPNLPQSIRGLWKADLFLGSAEPDHWVGTSVKINPDRLEAAPGLRIALVPSAAGRADAIRHDEAKNLIVCPMPYDGSFMRRSTRDGASCRPCVRPTSRCLRTSISHAPQIARQRACT